MTNILQYKYKKIYNNISNSDCTENQLNLIKDKYDKEIRSNRCTYLIRNLAQLLKVLEKRDCINEECINPLIFIANTLNRTDILSQLENFANFDPNGNSPPPPTGHQILPSISSDINERVYDLIATEIGNKWSYFARALKIPEGHIDQLKDSYKNISDRVYEILRYHRDTCDSRTWKSKLMEALSKARRNDLRKKVQHIFDTF